MISLQAGLSSPSTAFLESVEWESKRKDLAAEPSDWSAPFEELKKKMKAKFIVRPRQINWLPHLEPAVLLAPMWQPFGAGEKSWHVRSQRALDEESESTPTLMTLVEWPRGRIFCAPIYQFKPSARRQQ